MEKQGSSKEDEEGEASGSRSPISVPDNIPSLLVSPLHSSSSASDPMPLTLSECASAERKEVTPTATLSVERGNSTEPKKTLQTSASARGKLENTEDGKEKEKEKEKERERRKDKDKGSTGPEKKSRRKNSKAGSHIHHKRAKSTGDGSKTHKTDSEDEAGGEKKGEGNRSPTSPLQQQNGEKQKKIDDALLLWSSKGSIDEVPRVGGAGEEGEDSKGGSFRGSKVMKKIIQIPKNVVEGVVEMGSTKNVEDEKDGEGHRDARADAEKGGKGKEQEGELEGKEKEKGRDRPLRDLKEAFRLSWIGKDGHSPSGSEPNSPAVSSTPALVVPAPETLAGGAGKTSSAATLTTTERNRSPLSEVPEKEKEKEKEKWGPVGKMITMATGRRSPTEKEEGVKVGSESEKETVKEKAPIGMSQSDESDRSSTPVGPTKSTQLKAERKRRFQGAMHEVMNKGEQQLMLRNIAYFKKLVDKEMERVLMHGSTVSLQQHDVSQISGDAVLQKVSGMLEFLLGNTVALAQVHEGEYMFQGEELEYYVEETRNRFGGGAGEAEQTKEANKKQVVPHDDVANWDFAIPYGLIEPTFSAFLGEGGFSKVYKGQWRGKDVAVKQIKWISGSDTKACRQHIYIYIYIYIYILIIFEKKYLWVIY